MGWRPTLLLGALALLGLTWPPGSTADHVTANPQASARLGERVSDTAWRVEVDWRAVSGRRELVSCGSGSDFARVDRSDRVAGCEQVRRSG